MIIIKYTSEQIDNTWKQTNENIKNNTISYKFNFSKTTTQRNPSKCQIVIIQWMMNLIGCGKLKLIMYKQQRVDSLFSDIS